MNRILIKAAIALSIFTPVMTKAEKIIQTAGHDQLGDFAPEFAHLNDNILFGAATTCSVFVTEAS